MKQCNFQFDIVKRTVFLKLSFEVVCEKMFQIILCLLAVGLWGMENTVESSKILTIFPFKSRSHYIVLEALLKELAKRGHEITVASNFPQSKPLKNFRDIKLPMTQDLDVVSQKAVENAGNYMYVILSISQLTDIYSNSYETVFNSTEMIKIRSEEQFDLVIFEGVTGEVFMGYGAHFKCPLVSFSTAPEVPQTGKIVGNPSSISFVPTLMFHLSDPISFGSRLINFVLHNIGVVLLSRLGSLQRDYYKTKFPPSQYPSYDEMLKNVSLSMVTSHFSQGHPHPMVPALIEVGGIQVKQVPDELPADLKKWMDEATDGVIYLSMGSNVKSANFPNEKHEAFVNTFAKLKQRVVWKFENDSLPSMPKNVYISKWLPQDDLLAHPNLKLFITHGGLGSVLEAKVRAVPVVGIPIFTDQMANVARAKSEGWCLDVPFLDLTQDLLTSAVQEILTNSTYKDTVARLSAIYMDRPQSPLETGVFWIEYVLRHRGAKHMQSNSVHLNFFQLHSLDVIGFLGAVGLIALTINWLILKFIWRKVFGA